MNVNAAKCRITANSYGPPVSDGTLTNLNLSEYPNVINSFSGLIEDERKRRARRYSYNTYHPDVKPTDKQKSDVSFHKGWPENSIPWGRLATDRINDEIVKQGRANHGNKKLDGRPQSSPSSTRRPYKFENNTQQTVKVGKERPVGGGSTIRLIYKRPPVPEPPIDKMVQSGSKCNVPQSLIIVMGKTTPTRRTESSFDVHAERKRVQKENGRSKLPSYYLGELNEFDPNANSTPRLTWSPSFSSDSSNNYECDNCGGYPRFDDVGSFLGYCFQRKLIEKNLYFSTRFTLHLNNL